MKLDYPLVYKTKDKTFLCLKNKMANLNVFSTRYFIFLTLKKPFQMERLN